MHKQGILTLVCLTFVHLHLINVNVNVNQMLLFYNQKIRLERFDKL